MSIYSTAAIDVMNIIFHLTHCSSIGIINTVSNIDQPSCNLLSVRTFCHTKGNNAICITCHDIGSINTTFVS